MTFLNYLIDQFAHAFESIDSEALFDRLGRIFRVDGGLLENQLSCFDFDVVDHMDLHLLLLEDRPSDIVLDHIHNNRIYKVINEGLLLDSLAKKGVRYL
jgi:hypothetical protein